MPIYEYQCRACGAPHEAMRKMSDPPLRKCPACGKAQLKRLISAPMFRLKGGGWYETDFKSDQDRKRNLHADEKPDKAPPAAGTETKAAGEGKTESKAEAPKSEAKTEAKTEASTGSAGGAESRRSPARRSPAARPPAKRPSSARRSRPPKRR